MIRRVQLVNKLSLQFNRNGVSNSSSGVRLSGNILSGNCKSTRCYEYSSSDCCQRSLMSACCSNSANNGLVSPSCSNGRHSISPRSFMTRSNGIKEASHRSHMTFCSNGRISISNATHSFLPITVRLCSTSNLVEDSQDKSLGNTTIDNRSNKFSVKSVLHTDQASESNLIKHEGGLSEDNSKDVDLVKEFGDMWSWVPPLPKDISPSAKFAASSEPLTQDEIDDENDLFIKNKIVGASSYREVLNVFSVHRQEFTYDSYDYIVRRLTAEVSKRNVSPQELVSEPQFESLCEQLCRNARQYDGEPLLSQLALLAQLNVALDSTIVMTTLQMLRCEFSRLSTKQMLELHSTLASYGERHNELGEKLKLAVRATMLLYYFKQPLPPNLEITHLLTGFHIMVTRYEDDKKKSRMTRVAEKFMTALYKRENGIQFVSNGQVLQLTESLAMLRDLWEQGAATSALHHRQHDTETTGNTTRGGNTAAMQHMAAVRGLLNKKALQILVNRIADIERSEVVNTLSHLSTHRREHNDTLRAALNEVVTSRLLQESHQVSTAECVRAVSCMLHMSEISKAVVERVFTSLDAAPVTELHQIPLTDVLPLVDAFAATSSSLAVMEGGRRCHALLTRMLQHPGMQRMATSHEATDRYWIQTIMNKNNTEQDRSSVALEADQRSDYEHSEIASYGLPRMRGALADQRSDYEHSEIASYGLPRMGVALAALGYNEPGLLNCLLNYALDCLLKIENGPDNGSHVSTLKMYALQLWQAIQLTQQCDQKSYPAVLDECKSVIVSHARKRGAAQCRHSSLVRSLLQVALREHDSQVLVSAVYTRNLHYLDHVLVTDADGRLVAQPAEVTSGGVPMSSLYCPEGGKVYGILEVSPKWLLNRGTVHRAQLQLVLRALTAEGVTPLAIPMSRLILDHSTDEERGLYIESALKGCGLHL